MAYCGLRQRCGHRMRNMTRERRFTGRSLNMILSNQMTRKLLLRGFSPFWQPLVFEFLTHLLLRSLRSGKVQFLVSRAYCWEENSRMSSRHQDRGDCNHPNFQSVIDTQYWRDLTYAPSKIKNSVSCRCRGLPQPFDISGIL